ncbi:uncharacterized protein MELLADRAFT_86229 [Melampsora larici-populina 98AG31]|uniref:GCM domain-containing protein n=1 Tax=Melampsora larici-populina (strain 98AG31 / pathotype 3-4-7) TaxID=747676 RepID=F4RL05_MELLP|nr:uncharacterized protein MELLADRAFT_86229 [Melampsora larici-populina 98AG31]EGG06946.1 hypothetical protein MELLADRAFT_86229 [Melampsora larici-populina 98AG31]
MSEYDSESSLDLPGPPEGAPFSQYPTQTALTSPFDPVVATMPSTAPDSNTTSPEKIKKKKRNRPKKTGKKFKIPVPATGELKTYIDHGSQCDGQGYPIWPNGETVYHGPWKTTWYTCLGVLHCDDNFCDYAAPPPTAEGKAAQAIEDHPECPAVECSGKHIWTQCTQTHCRVDVEKATGWAVLRHSGTHDHIWPTPKKADPLAMLDLTNELVKNPKAGPLVLKVGQAGASQTITAPPIIEIHPAFANAGRLGYLRRKVLVAKGLMPEKESLGGGDRLIMDLMHWGRNGLRLISTSLLGSNVHITFQTEWMAEQIVRRDQNGKTYSGGFLSDVTYRFFHNGYLLTTSMYSDIMTRWIPIQLTWLWGLETAHYRAHFKTLLNQIKDADLTHHEQDLLTQQVVDFSVAQKKGFIEAYMEVFNEADPGKALDKLKGCREHYRQSITRIKKNRNVVDASQVLAMDLLEPDKEGGMKLAEKFDQIGRLFPKSKAWLDWWNTADIHLMLFCSRTRLPLDDPPLEGEEVDDGLPDTTNGQESMHRQYYIISTVATGNLWWKLWGGRKNALDANRTKMTHVLRIQQIHSFDLRRLAALLGQPTCTATLSPRTSLIQPAPSQESKTAAGRRQPWNHFCQHSLQCGWRVPTGRQDTTSMRPNPSNDTDIDILTTDPSGDVPRLYERTRLDFTTNPMHVYFHLGGVAGLSGDDRATFMNEMEWPEVLKLNDIEYTIVSRGFWAYNHYWCKLVRYLKGVRGVWFFDDRQDDGRAQLLGRELSLLSGAQPSTSWLVYSRKPSTDEQNVIDRGIAKIMKANPDPLGDIPFTSAADLEGLEEQILEVSAATQTLSGSGFIGNKAKEAFSSSAPPPLPAVKIEPDVKVNLAKAMEAFSLSALPAPPAVKIEPELNERLVKAKDALASVKAKEDLESSVVKTEPTDTTNSGNVLRLCIKRPQHDSPSKSPSVSPSKAVVVNGKGATQPKKRAKAEKDQQKLPEVIQAKPKAKATKGKKKR